MKITIEMTKDDAVELIAEISKKIANTFGDSIILKIEGKDQNVIK